MQEALELNGKKAADALEALIGIVFEVAGEVAVEYWLHHIGILPGFTGVRPGACCSDYGCT